MVELHRTIAMAHLVLFAFFFISILFLYIRKLILLNSKVPIYLLDYACSKGTEESMASVERLLYFSQELKTMSIKNILFQTKVTMKSGVGEEAYVPRVNLVKGRSMTLMDSHEQAQILLVGAVETLLRKTRVSPQLIDILIVNSGVFNPTPSLSSILINHFNMKSSIRSFHLSGMGCSAGLISVSLAKDLLSVKHQRRKNNSYCSDDSTQFALVASTEILSSIYDGKDRSMMVTNCLFRSAGNALLLSNNPKDRRRSKMELLHVIRVNMSSKDEAHNAIILKEDVDGIVGAQLSPRLIDVATMAIRQNIRLLAPRVLPLLELLKIGVNEVVLRGSRLMMKKHHMKKSYVPNFKLVFNHFCIHPGSKVVIEGVGKSLGLTNYDIEPSLMALHRFGNTSSSGIWYELAYIEAKNRLKAGDNVWQLGLGSGFKCNSAVWRVLRTIDENELFLGDNPWHDCIHRYPVHEDLSKLPHVVNALSFLQKLT